MSQLDASQQQLLTTLEGAECDYCEDGTLERKMYKENVAAVCKSCGTPAAQLW